MLFIVCVHAIQLFLNFTCDFLIAVSSDNISGIRGKPTVLEGSNLQLFCEASSRVETNITWTKEKTGNQGNTGVMQEGKVLTITNTDRSDAGTFTCTANNGFGKLEKRIVYVNVTCEYALIEKNFDQCQIEMNFPFIFFIVVYYFVNYLY